MESAAQSERPSPRPSVLGRVRGSILASATGLAASLASYACVSRFVTPAEYGRASVILSIWGLLTVATEWCAPVMMRYGPVELARCGSLRTTLSTRLLFALPALVLLLPTAPLYFLFTRGWPASLAWGMGAYLVVSAALGTAQSCAVAAQRFGALALANTIARAAPVVVIVGALAVGRPVGAEALVFAAVAGAGLGAALLFVALSTLLGLARPDRALFGRMWRYSLPGLVAAPSLATITYVDPIILQQVVSHAEIGRYQLAYLTVTLFGAAGASVNSVLSPELIAARERGDESAVERYRLVIQPRLALELGFVACAAACVAAPMVRLLLPAAWAGAADPVGVLTVAGALMLGVWSLHPLVAVTDSVWSLEAATILSAVANVAGDLWLAPRAGVIGVALANVASWAVQLIVLALLLHRYIGARRIALALVPCAAAVLVVVLAAPGWARVLTAVMLVGVAAALRSRAKVTADLAYAR